MFDEIDEWFVLPFRRAAPFSFWVEYCIEVTAYYGVGVVEFLGHFVVFLVQCLSSSCMQGHVACDYSKLFAVDRYVQACAPAWDNHVEFGDSFWQSIFCIGLPLRRVCGLRLRATIIVGLSSHILWVGFRGFAKFLEDI